jgi:hypothetical protein
VWFVDCGLLDAGGRVLVLWLRVEKVLAVLVGWDVSGSFGFAQDDGAGRLADREE